MIGVAAARQLLSTMTWALKTAWATNSGATLGVAGLLVLRGLLPAALAVAVRGLINAAVGASSTGNFQPLLPWLLLGFGLALLEALSPLATKLCLQRLADDMNLRVTTNVLQQAAALDLAMLEDPRLRDTVERAQQDTAGALLRLITDFQAVCSDIIQVLFLVAVLMYVEPLVLAVVCPFALPYLYFRWRNSKRHYSEETSWTTRRRWARYFAAHLTGHPAAAETKLLGLGPLFLAKFRTLTAQFRDRDRSRYKRDFLAGSIFAVLTIVSFYALFARVALAATRGALTVGDVAIFAVITSRLRATLERLIMLIGNVAEQSLHVGHLRSFLAMPPGMAHKEGRVPATIRGEVQLIDVSFTYPGSSRPALAGISLHVKPGEVVALVGENGAGKTTLAKVMARLYDPDSGSVQFDGIDVKQWPLEELHRSIGFLCQDFARYEATASDNIAYGDWRRMLERPDQVRAAAAFVDIHDFILSLPQGYETMLGRMFGQYDLSGGQWLRLAMARTLARNASLLILDEPTANLDARAEYELFRRFRALAEGRTTVLISHRFTTIGLADRIVVMDRGRIVEIGTHDELMERVGTYAKLYELHRQISPTGDA